VRHVKAHRTIDNRTYRTVLVASDRRAARELKALVKMGILEREGAKGSAARYPRARANPP
jgi:predicted HTH transcriptional regulator